MQNPDEDEEEVIADNVEKTQEAVQDYQEENYGDDSPTANESENLYSLFHYVLDKSDSSKVANLDKFELGNLDMSVRDCQAIAILCDTVGYSEVAKWLRSRAEVILATSSSKKGWLAELFVSAKKFSSKEKRLGIPEQNLMQPEKKGFWSKLRR